MIEAVSCGGVVIHRGKVLLLYKNQNGRYIGWVMPKGTVEKGENRGFLARLLNISAKPIILLKLTAI